METDITGIALTAVVFMFLLSGPRGRNRYYPLGFGLLLTCLAVFYAWTEAEPVYYAVGLIALARALYLFVRWRH